LFLALNCAYGGDCVLKPDIFQVRALLREPVQRAHQLLGETDAIRFHLMAILVHLTQAGIRIEMLARFVSVADLAAAEVHLFVTAPTTFVADGFPFFTGHDPVPSTDPMPTEQIDSGSGGIERVASAYRRIVGNSGFTIS